ncbi:MAG: cobyric acid synthase, partial [Duncaniella sp.]|nr:cobyric acid synthase [Duncaniella sp.]
CMLADVPPDGCRASERVMGCEFYGILDNPSVVNALISSSGSRETPCETLDYEAYKESQYDALAAMLRKYVDIDRIYKILSEDD